MIYSLDSAIHLLNNWGQIYSCNRGLHLCLFLHCDKHDHLHSKHNLCDIGLFSHTQAV